MSLYSVQLDIKPAENKGSVEGSTVAYNSVSQFSSNVEPLEVPLTSPTQFSTCVLTMT
jgi:hypothetical protein